MKKITHAVVLLLMVFVQGCGTYFNQPTESQNARLGESTSVSKALTNLPLPQQPVVVGVYNFKDQTGQFRATENGSTFSTAVTQGATTILLKALEDSKWFVPLERENINNLLNERNIIETTRNQYSKAAGKQPERLKPLLFAGILLEGGIVSYDTNVVTGGLGARYFGIGGSTQYRQDRVTVYLRAVSTSTGEILKTVYVSKTILSQALDASFFRFVKFQRLLEAETGFTKNEPAQLAVTEAVEKSVQALIIEGVKDGLWSGKAEDKTKLDALIADYEIEKTEAINTKLYDRYFKERRGKSALKIASGVALIAGDLADPSPDIFGSLGYRTTISPYLSINGTLNYFSLKNGTVFQEDFGAVDLNLEYTILPFDDLSPFVYGGLGANLSENFNTIDAKIQYGLGIEYVVSDGLGIYLFAEQNTVFSDELDTVISGKRDDQFYRFGLGLNVYLSPPNGKSRAERKESRKHKKQRKLDLKISKRTEEKLKIANAEIGNKAIGYTN